MRTLAVIQNAFALGAVAKIQDRVAQSFGVTRQEMLSRRHNRRAVIPRHVAIYLARKLTPHSLPAIGRCFGRDHTTVMHAIRALEARMEHYATLKDQVDGLEKELASPEAFAAEQAVRACADLVADEIHTLAAQAFARDPIRAAAAVAAALRPLANPNWKGNDDGEKV